MEVYEDVLGLQIAIHDIVLVKVLYSQYHFSYDYPCFILSKLLLPAQMEEELASGAKLEHEVQILLCSECLNEVTDEGMFQLHQYLALEDDLLKFALLHQLFDRDHFHGA